MENMLGKKGYWRDRGGELMLIANMTPIHRLNAARLMRAFIEGQTAAAIDDEPWPGEVTNPIALLALIPFKEKVAELEKGLEDLAQLDL